MCCNNERAVIMKSEKIHTLKRKRTLPLWFYPAWCSRNVAVGTVTILLGYITFYSTNILELDPKIVGTLLMISKLFDGITDLVAGFLIDRTNTRFGRARPYEFAVLLFCLFTLLLFSAPVMGKNATAGFVFVVYTLIFSVFNTLFATSEPVYLARSVERDDDRMKVLSVAGIFSGVFSGLIGLIMPLLINAWGDTQIGWRKITLVLVVPCLIFSMLRFITVKEKVSSNLTAAQKIDFKEGINLLFHNRYIIIFAVVMLLTNAASNLQQSHVYYYTYIVGDLTKQSVVGMSGAFSMLFLAISPILAKKINLTNVMRLGLLMGVIGYLIPLLGLRSVPVLMIGMALSMAAILPIYLLSASIVINCMDYGEWKSGKRGEGIYSCVSGFGAKVGIGIASAIIGFTLSLGNFDAKLPVQPASSEKAIISLYTVIPAVLLLVSLILFMFYDLDKKLPKIQEDLKLRNEAEDIPEVQPEMKQ